MGVKRSIRTKTRTRPGRPRRRPRRAPILVFTAALFASPAAAHEVLVEPYLQLATPTSIKVLWETDEAGDSRVEWGVDPSLGSETPAASAEGGGDTRIHTVALEGLTPATRYFYRAVTGAEVGDVHDFVTPAEASAEAPFRLLAMSDMQRDPRNPDVFREIVEEGVIPFVRERFSPDLARELAFTLIPGDLVAIGPDHPSWAETFFTPSRALNRHVPLYPVPGNHEADTDLFFRYFDLPTNGTPGFEEHWWFHDHGNLRVVGLDSNSGYRTQEQLDWLDGVLADACADPDLDFVFAQLHHPLQVGAVGRGRARLQRRRGAAARGVLHAVRQAQRALLRAHPRLLARSVPGPPAPVGERGDGGREHRLLG